MTSGIDSQFLPLSEGNSGIGQELTSGIDSQFLPILEGNFGIRNQCWKWIPHFKSVKWWIPEFKWGIEKNILLKVSIISMDKICACICSLWTMTPIHNLWWLLMLSESLSLGENSILENTRKKSGVLPIIDFNSLKTAWQYHHKFCGLSKCWF